MNDAAWGARGVQRARTVKTPKLTPIDRSGKPLAVEFVSRPEHLGAKRSHGREFSPKGLLLLLQRSDVVGERRRLSR
jgi:hypothetical protein